MRLQVPLEIVSAGPAVRAVFASPEQAVFACWMVTVERLKSLQLVFVLTPNMPKNIFRISERSGTMGTVVLF